MLPNRTAFPAALTDRKQWVAAKVRPDPEKPGKLAKMLHNPRTGYAASTKDPTTWGTFAEACAGVERLRKSSPPGEQVLLGFVFTRADPFVAIDFDHCFDEFGTLDADTLRRAQALDSYTERSVSGRGIHVIVEAQLPLGGRRRGDVEMYDQDRFFVLTGDVLFDKGAIAYRQAEVNALHREVFGESDLAMPVPITAKPSYEVDDDELLARAFRAANGPQFRKLWEGDTTGYPSHSEADLALAGHLAFWTNNDAPRIDRLFRRSGLCRPKWDEKHFGDGTTYGQATLAKAVKGRAQPVPVAQPSGLCVQTPAQTVAMSYDDTPGAQPGGLCYESDAKPKMADFPELPPEVRFPPELAASASPWLNAYIDYSKEWAPSAYEHYHEAVALWALSTVSAHRVVVHLGGPRYTNLYIANIAPSSMWSKTTVAGVAVDFLRRAGLSYLLAPDESTPQGFIMAAANRDATGWERLTEEQREHLALELGFAGQHGWAYDEFGTKVEGMMRDGGPMADFRGLLRRWDDCPEDYEYVTTSRGRAVVQRPFLALLASLTPADLLKHGRQGGPLWQDGFWARFAFACPPPGAQPAVDRFPSGERIPPAWLLKQVVEWHRSLGIPEVTVTEHPQDGKKPGPPQWDVAINRPPEQVCTLGKGVEDAFYAYHQALVKLAAELGNPDFTGNYTRFATKALRIATLIASLENEGRIELCHWALGQEIAERWREGLHNVYAAINAGQASPQAVQEEKIRKVVARKGEATVRDVLKVLKEMSSLTCSNAMEAMERVGLLEVARVTHKGTRVYRVAAES